jgi:AcrR family transcriptional regulator
MRSGSPFYHFKSKGELLYAVMDEGMRSAIDRQRLALEKSQHTVSDPRGELAILIRNQFDVLLGPGSDFIPVMLYESRALNARQRASLRQLQSDYEAAWTPVLQALQAAGRLHADVRLARLLIFGALNWAVQWYDARKGASLDDLTAAALALFIHEA